MNEYIIKYHGILNLEGYDVELLNESYAIVTTDAAGIEQLYHHIQIEYVEPAKKLFLSRLDSMGYSCINSVKSKSGMGLNGRGVAIGVIDSGIDVTHPDFLNPDGKTRVAYFWDMEGIGTPPAGFLFGAEYNAQQIDSGAIQNGDTVGHGTAVSGIAAGNMGIASGASIIVVKLNLREVRSTDIMRGIKYVIDRAQSMEMPCAINLSFGTNDGSHTGDSLFETYISDMARRWKSMIVCAAGNEGYSGHHFEGKLGPVEELNVDFATAAHISRMYLSLWKNFADRVSYELIGPSGRSSGRLTEVMGRLDTVLDGVRVRLIYGQPNHYSDRQEVYLQFEAINGPIPNGIWTLRCYGEDIVEGTFNVWLPNIGAVTERTAFLEPSVYLTMTIPSTSDNVISVGGYRGSTGTISAFSGRGNHFEGCKAQLDIVAPAENIFTAKAGGGYDAFTGTSMAAPFVTGSAALMMEWGIVRGNDIFLYGERIKAFLCRNAVRKENVKYPNPMWGYGALNLCETMEDLIYLMRR